MLPTENPWPLAVMSIAVGIVCGLRWLSQRHSLWLIASVVSLAVAGLAFALDAWIETPAEIVSRNVVDLCWSFQKKENEKFLSLFSPTALLPRQQAALALNLVTVHEDLRVSDIQVTTHARNSQATSRFRANASISVTQLGASNYHPSYWELDWQVEAGQWRVTKIKRLDPIKGTEVPFLSGK